MAKDYGLEVDKIKASIPETELKKDLAVQKAMDVVKAAAVVTEVDKKSEKTEEKKPAAKKTSTTAKKSTTKKADGETAEKKPAAKKTTTAANKADGETAENERDHRQCGFHQATAAIQNAEEAAPLFRQRDGIDALDNGRPEGQSRGDAPAGIDDAQRFVGWRGGIQIAQRTRHHQ